MVLEKNRMRFANRSVKELEREADLISLDLKTAEDSESGETQELGLFV